MRFKWQSGIYCVVYVPRSTKQDRNICTLCADRGEKVLKEVSQEWAKVKVDATAMGDLQKMADKKIPRKEPSNCLQV